jgi:hypothetical protein
MTAPAVGDVFVSTWGYDQTNVDFFRCERVSGEWIWVVPLLSVTVEQAGFMSERVVPGEPVPGGRAMRRKWRTYADYQPDVVRFSVNTYAMARTYEGGRMLATHYA